MAATTPAAEPVAEPAEPVAREGVPPELALAIREEREHGVQPGTTLPSPREWEATMAIARQIAATPFVPESYRNQPEAVVAAILTGRELGIGPMQALRDIHMVDGRPAFAAQLMLAKMRQGGIVLLETDSNEERAWIKARRADNGEVAEFEFTIAEAETAGLLAKKGQSWQKYRKDMLWARAVSRMARRFGSDMLGGLVYSKEELEDLDDAGGYGTTGTGYDATTFDPGSQLLPTAHRGPTAEVVEKLNSDQYRLASDIDWTAMLEQAALQTLPPRPEWTDAHRTEFMRRWANAIAKLLELAQASTEPGVYHPDLGLAPEGDVLIVEAFEFAFGITLEQPLPKVERPEPEESESAEDTDPDVVDGEATEVTDDDA